MFVDYLVDWIGQCGDFMDGCGEGGDLFVVELQMVDQ